VIHHRGVPVRETEEGSREMENAEKLSEAYAAEIDYLAHVSWQQTPVLPSMSKDAAVENIDRYNEALAEQARPALETIRLERFRVACGMQGPSDERVAQMRERLKGNTSIRLVPWRQPSR
jgi:hypothetical protein